MSAGIDPAIVTFRDGDSDEASAQRHGRERFHRAVAPWTRGVRRRALVSPDVATCADCLAELRNRGQRVIEASAEAEEAWVEHVAAVSSFGLFNRANSWYLGANVPGKTRSYMPYSAGLNVTV